MRKFLSIWFALSLALGPVASAFSSPMPYMAGSGTEEHCMGHESASEESVDTQPDDCCKSGYDQNQCCDHCMASVSALLNTGLSLILSSIAVPAISFIQPVLPETHSPPYRPPQA